REGLTHAQPVDLEEVVENRLQGQAALLSIGDRAKAGQPRSQRGQVVTPPLLGLGCLPALPDLLQPVTFLRLLHPGKGVPHVYVLADIADQPLRLELVVRPALAEILKLGDLPDHLAPRPE